jgi:hypothetical protein
MRLQFGLTPQELGTDMFLRRYRGEYLDDVTAETWRQLQDEKLHNWHPTPNIYFEVKWCEVSYGEVLVDKSTMHIRVTL